jgi:DUF438 domain-containing protein
MPELPKMRISKHREKYFLDYQDGKCWKNICSGTEEYCFREQWKLILKSAQEEEKMPNRMKKMTKEELRQQQQLKQRELIRYAPKSFATQKDSGTVLIETIMWFDPDGWYVHISDYYSLMQAARSLEKDQTPLPERFGKIAAELDADLERYRKIKSPLDYFGGTQCQPLNP